MREPLRARMIYEEGLRRYIQKRTEDLERSYRTRYPDNSDQVKQAVLEELAPRIREKESQVEQSRLGAIRATAQALRNQSDKGRRVAELTRYAETEDAEKSRIRNLFDGFVAENERLAELERAEQDERERRERENASRLAESGGRHRRRRRHDSTDLSSMVDDIRDRPLATPTGASVASTSAVEGSDPESGRSTAVGALGASDEAVSRVEDEPVVESASEDENVQEDAAPKDESDTLKSWPHAHHALPSIQRRPGRSFATEDTDVTEDTTESTESTEDTNVDVDVAEDEDTPEDTEDTEDEDVDVAEGDIDEDTEVEDDDVDVEEDVNETDTEDDIEDEDEEDFDEVEDFDEDAAVVEVDPEAEPVDDADKPLGLDNLDEVDDKVDTKKRNFLIAGVA